MAKKAKVKKAKKKTAAKAKAPKKAKKKAAAKKSAVKKAKKAPARKTVPAPAPAKYKPAANETKAGDVDDYFSRIGVIALELKAPLALGDSIHVHGHTTDYNQKVESMQIDHAPVPSAKKGDSVGIKVGEKSRKGDQVFIVR